MHHKQKINLIIGSGILFLTLFYVLSVQADASKQYDQRSFLNNVVVLGVYGFLGDSEGGVGQIINRIRNDLVGYGVPPQNISARSWNSDANDNPSASPNLQKLTEWVIERGTSNPSYFVIIGHSYGGWAAAKLSNHDPIREPDMLFTIDPVLGPGNNASVDPKGRQHLINWKQDISVIEIATDLQCVGVDSGTCQITYSGQHITACGATMPNMDNRQHNFVKKSNCETRKICGRLNPKNYRTAHTKIDEDSCISEIIRNMVVGGLYATLYENGWLPSTISSSSELLKAE